MNIFVTGLCTLHWGRLEYGNIGNYYIIVPLFRELHKVFPEANIYTTLQLTNEFAKKEKIEILPLDIYYGWRKNSLDTVEAFEEYGIAQLFSETGIISTTTPYIKVLQNMDFVIDFSGDMWGDNSASMGENRFLVELLKIRVAQLLGKKTILFASSPGPVTGDETKELAKEVYSNYNLVINRESFSKTIMMESGFDISKTKSYACPAWLFDESCYPEKIDSETIRTTEGFSCEKKNIGLILTTYSLPGSSFDMWERNDQDFSQFIDLVEHIVNYNKEKVFLISHSNGFELPPNFKRTHWRDYKMITRLYDLLQARGRTNMNDIHVVDTLYQPWEMHRLIGNLDMLISGRVHGAVAGLEQAIPTLAFDYKNGPLAHKMSGFFDVIGMKEYVIPRDSFDFIQYFEKAYNKLPEIKKKLLRNLPEVRKKAKDSFEELKVIMRNY